MKQSFVSCNQEIYVLNKLEEKKNISYETCVSL